VLECGLITLLHSPAGAAMVEERAARENPEGAWMASDGACVERQQQCGLYRGQIWTQLLQHTVTIWSWFLGQPPSLLFLLSHKSLPVRRGREPCCACQKDHVTLSMTGKKSKNGGSDYGSSRTGVAKGKTFNYINKPAKKTGCEGAFTSVSASEFKCKHKKA